MKWPWRSNRDDVEKARQERDRAERRVEETRPLARKLEKHNQTNQFAARFRAALGGD